MTRESVLSMSKIIMGTWQAGKQYWNDIDDTQIQAAIAAALDSGVTSFDTAEEYGAGHSERALGKALAGRRTDVLLLSKVFSNHLRREQVFEACHRSLKNLKTDYLDLYQIHWPAGSWGSDEVPLEETMEALCLLRHQGKIREIGVSNFNLQQLKIANRDGDIGTIQPPYNLFWRHFDKELRAYCEAHQIQVLAYSALGQGMLSGRYRSADDFRQGDNRRANKLFQEPTLSRALAALDELRPIAESHNISLTQLSLAWCIAQPLTHAIVGVRNATQIREVAQTMKCELSESVLAEVDAIGRKVSDPNQDDPLLWTWQP